MKKILKNERFIPLKELAILWYYDFLQNEKTYTGKLFPEIISGDFSKITDAEKKIVIKIKENLKENEWNNFSQMFLKMVEALKIDNHNKDILRKAENYILNEEFIEFENLYKQNKNLLKRFEDKYKAGLNRYIKKIHANIAKLSIKNFNESVAYFYKTIKLLPEQYKKNSGIYLENIEKLINILKKYNFFEADEFCSKRYLMDTEIYENLKKNYVLEYFKGKNIDEQKALAISSVKSNVLLKARAGSGKTSTICLKTLLLIEKYNVMLDEILILAFNRDAKNRIKEDLHIKHNIDFENAKTFHSFAKSIYNDKKIVEERKRKSLINKAINIVLEKENYKKDFYKFYKTALDVPVKKEINIDNNSKIKFLKDLSQITLKGEIVKSFGEKYIADFLFEHGIDYEYEKNIIFTEEEKDALNIDKGWNVYRPDFYIQNNGKEFYLEHWGVDENALEPGYFNRKGVISDVSKYIRNMHIKRRYFRKKGIPLIETWARDSQIRENFEITLFKTLKNTVLLR